jgi:hypothetical protein
VTQADTRRIRQLHFKKLKDEPVASKADSML